MKTLLLIFLATVAVGQTKVAKTGKITAATKECPAGFTPSVTLTIGESSNVVFGKQTCIKATNSAPDPDVSETFSDYKERLKAGGVAGEVMDVPAVKEDIERPDVTAYRCGILGGAMCLPIQEGPPYRWTCADKHRILLTDESGEKHCILFPKESK